MLIVGSEFVNSHKMFITALIVCLFEVAQAYIGTGVIAAGSCTTCQMSVGGGGWSQWSEWSRCGMTLGVMSQSRYRTCSMPRCTGGVVSEARPCIVYIQRPAPQWSEWGPWSACRYASHG
ncbi:hypothetical protein NECAME_05961 [Necator americanus]|uniref:Thrombospondin type 1 domain protein n=1 Tax=Necator americanus TaxID=51031 RepID=W2TXR2_NECAM|nr:hypothetical protein NECAME_05961 [Necator americanus]ETN86469.1 hypothetical protein NECAME_05961 [Necator americanus]